jgi:hypothetical protein
MSEQTVSVQMTDDQFAVFRADQNAHNQAMLSIAAEQMMHAKRCADYAADPKPPIPLRDWFAGQALATIKQINPHLPGSPAGATWPEPLELANRRAAWAYIQADAMIAAREARHD